MFILQLYVILATNKHYSGAFCCSAVYSGAHNTFPMFSTEIEVLMSIPTRLGLSKSNML